MKSYRLSPTLSGMILSISLVFAPATVRAVKVVDDRGVEVALAQTPRRIVSLLPSLTESVCALGRCAALVGVDRYSNFPATVLQLPKVGGGLDPNIEAIVALKPDVVLLATSSRAVARLQSLGVAVLVLEPKTYADVQRSLSILGQVLESPHADAVWSGMLAAIQTATASVPHRFKNARVYFEVSPSPHAASPTSFVGETLIRLGLQNIVPIAWGPFPQINPEFVVQANPRVLMVSDSQRNTLTRRPGWGGMQAVQSGQVCSFNAEQSDVLSRPGPRMAQGAAAIIQCLQGL